MWVLLRELVALEGTYARRLFTPGTGRHHYGNTDAFVLVLLAVTVLGSERGWAGISGVLIGVGGLIKTWPAAAGLATFRHGYTGRRRALTGLVLTLLLGPVLGLAVGGASGFVDFLKVTFAARAQPILSYSVWSTPFLLFSHSGIVRPVFVSPVLRDIATLVLAAWVIGLLVLTLSWSDSSVLGFWNGASRTLKEETCRRSFGSGAVQEMEVLALRCRPTGAGVKPPCAALAEDRRGERQGKGAQDASGGDQEDVPEASDRG